MNTHPLIQEHRKATYPIHPLILNRWSPRAMSGEALTHEELMTLFEAARWAPSSYNAQPWRFYYATKDSPRWKDVFSLLGEFNQNWCKNAGALVILTAQKNFEYNGKPNRNALSDCGAAWENLAIQACDMDLVAHGMAGYDVEKTREFLKLKDDIEVIHMFALGKHGKIDSLSEELQKIETPSDRKAVSEIAIDIK